MNNIFELKKKYPNIPVVILENYEEADEFFLINEGDKDLKAIKIPLPKQPSDISEIFNFGIPKKDQTFRYEEIPQKLSSLIRNLKIRRRTETSKNKEAYVTLEYIRKYIYEHKEDYKDEIAWMQQQWNYRLNGKWFYIDGKATWICGWHWFYLNWYTLLNGYKPEYRDKDRRWFIAVNYFYYENIDENGIKHRDYLNLGVNCIDFRRSGKTSKSGSILLELLTRSSNFDAGIQGMNSTNGEVFFTKHIIYPFKRLPFFFKPLYDGSTDPKSKLELKPAAVRTGSKGSVLSDKQGLDSSCNFASTAKKEFYDKSRLNFIAVDEIGKTVEENVYERHATLKECIAQGSGAVRVGFMVCTTTVEEITLEALKSFRALCDASKEDTLDNGRTLSGLRNIFFPAYDGLEGFIDKYGASVINTPTEEQAEFIGRNYGAREFLTNKMKRFHDLKDMTGLTAHRRKFPMCFRDCFIPSGDSDLFPRKILEDRIADLSFEKEMVINGDFEWSQGFGSDVVFIIKLDGRGKWFVSKQLNKMESNRKVITYNKLKQKFIYSPANMNSYIASSDGYQYGKKKGTRLSNGGIAVFWKHDSKIDGNNKPIEEWESHRFVATYQNRPDNDTTNKFSEDVLKACIYYGSPVYPEINIKDVYRHFEEWGYDGYLYYDLEYVGGKWVYSESPGFTSLSKSVQDLFNGMKNYLQIHGHRDRHIELLQDCLEITGIDDMTNYDRFTASCGCLRALKSYYGQYVDEQLNAIGKNSYDLISVYGSL